MKRRTRIALFLLVFAAWLASSTSLAAQDRGPSTPEERKKAIEITRQLEVEPLANKSRSDREWLLKWIIEIPDISVTVCPSFLDPLLGSKKSEHSILVAQMMFGQAAFIIENPTKAKEDELVYVAGLESVLKAYEAVLRKKPSARHAFLDGLLAKRDRGELGDFVKQKTAECKGPAKSS